jgi:hypothetical protein
MNHEYFQKRIEAASAALNSGFRTKAAKKDAIDQLNQAYYQLRHDMRVQIRAVKDAKHEELIAASGKTKEELTEMRWHDGMRYWTKEGMKIIKKAAETHDAPFDLHHVRDRHIDNLFTIIGVAQEVRTLVMLRETIKNAEIAPPAPKSNREEEITRKTLEQLREMRLEQFEHGCDLHDIFGRLPVTASWHWVTNQYGTTFERVFYYMDGKLTPLSIIIAILEEKEKD